MRGGGAEFQGTLHPLPECRSDPGLFLLLAGFRKRALSRQRKFTAHTPEGLPLLDIPTRPHPVVQASGVACHPISDTAVFAGSLQLFRFSAGGIGITRSTTATTTLIRRTMFSSSLFPMTRLNNTLALHTRDTMRQFLRRFPRSLRQRRQFRT